MATKRWPRPEDFRHEDDSGGNAGCFLLAILTLIVLGGVAYYYLP